jgi:hypothetical protein
MVIFRLTGIWWGYSLFPEADDVNILKLETLGNPYM